MRRLLEEVALPAGRWVEPCAGDGAIIRAVRRTGITWSAGELRPECERDLRDLATDGLHIGDIRDFRPPTRFAVAITNPPYRIARDVVGWCREHAEISVLLLRLNFLGSEERAALMREAPPDVFVLPNRPSFDGRGTDSIEYAWFLWGNGRPAGTRGGLVVLPPTPLHERRAG